LCVLPCILLCIVQVLPSVGQIIIMKRVGLTDHCYHCISVFITFAKHHRHLQHHHHLQHHPGVVLVVHYVLVCYRGEGAVVSCGSVFTGGHLAVSLVVVDISSVSGDISSDVSLSVKGVKIASIVF